ncbi:hypothetical protein ACFL2Q_12880 [Thermodesulfobacteriota bacterium]
MERSLDSGGKKTVIFNLNYHVYTKLKAHADANYTNISATLRALIIDKLRAEGLLD